MHCAFEAKDRERKNRGAAIIFNLMSDGLSLPIFMNTLSHRAPKFWAPMKGEKESEREIERAKAKGLVLRRGGGAQG